MNTLKNQIKALATAQVEAKANRKTVNLSVPRTMEPGQATFLHQQNRYKLRELYMAYGLSRGKTQEQIEANPKTPINMDSVNKLIEQYGKVVHAD